LHTARRIRSHVSGRSSDWFRPWPRSTSSIFSAWVFSSRRSRRYTIIETARLNGLDPEAYLRAVIACIADHPIKRIGQLLPWNINLS
jgi:hypothetical protein